jgi:hypothetical protein
MGTVRGRGLGTPRLAGNAVTGLLALALAGSAFAQDPGAERAPDAGTPSGAAPSVDLDRLLKLPDSYDAGAVAEKRGGGTQDEWRKRFDKARSDLTEAEQALQRTQTELESAASESGSYQMNAPGVQNPEASPVSFSLRQKLKENRSAVEDRKRALRQLEIEADLADVPVDWRGFDPATKRGSESSASGLAPPESTP